MRAALVGVRGVRGDGRYRDDARGVDVDVASMVTRRRSGPTRLRLSGRIRSRARTTREGLVPPSEENVRVLTSMGFDEAAARRALQRANDDVQRGDFLLSG